MTKNQIVLLENQFSFLEGDETGPIERHEVFRESKCNFMYTVVTPRITGSNRWRQKSYSDDSEQTRATLMTSDDETIYVPDNSVWMGTEDGK